MESWEQGKLCLLNKQVFPEQKRLVSQSSWPHVQQQSSKKNFFTMLHCPPSVWLWPSDNLCVYRRGDLFYESEQRVDVTYLVKVERPLQQFTSTDILRDKNFFVIFFAQDKISIWLHLFTPAEWPAKPIAWVSMEQRDSGDKTRIGKDF